MPQAEWAPGVGTGGCIEIFEYPADPNAPRLADWDGWTAAAGPGPGAPVKDSAKAISEVKVRAEFDQRLNEETRKAFEAGRARGRLDG